MRYPAGSLLLLSALGLTGCDTSRPSGSANASDFDGPWTTLPGFEFGERVGDNVDAQFDIISAVRLLGDGDRVVVVEPRVPRVTIWTFDGSLIRTVGRRGEAPGEFQGGIFVQVHAAGFNVRDAQRFTLFSTNGDLVGTVPYPPRSLGFRGFGLGAEVLLGDGSVLATPRVPPAALMGFGGDDPIDAIPVFRLRPDGDLWAMDEIAGLDVRNSNLTIIPEGRTLYDGGFDTTQPFGDFDLRWFDPHMESVLVVRRNLGGGMVELVEIEATGDTAWHRRLATPPVRLGSDRADRFSDDLAKQLAGVGDGPQGHLAMRSAVKQALYVPDPLPGVRQVFGTSSGRIWLSGFETEDGMGVWYSVPRGTRGSEVRKVLLPTGFRPMDATDTHVWGVRQDELGTQYVVGRRLVSPPLGTDGGG